MHHSDKTSSVRRLAAPAAVALAGLLAAGGVAAGQMGDIAHGGRLYDKWYGEAEGAAKPTESHALYPTDRKYAKKAGANWRCKECHGWDYMGKDGAYAKGKHSTGIKGVNAMRNADPGAVVKILEGGSHGFAGKLSAGDLNALALFVTKGQIDVSPYVDMASKKVNGDAAKGAGYFDTICAQCHGADGRDINFKTPEKPEFVGTIANANPWEFLHKVYNGQPGEQMPALRGLDPRIAIDIATYSQTLPAK